MSGVVRELSNMQNCQSPVSMSQWVSEWHTIISARDVGASENPMQKQKTQLWQKPLLPPLRHPNTHLNMIQESGQFHLFALNEQHQVSPHGRETHFWSKERCVFWNFLRLSAETFQKLNLHQCFLSSSESPKTRTCGWLLRNNFLWPSFIPAPRKGSVHFTKAGFGWRAGNISQIQITNKMIFHCLRL